MTDSDDRRDLTAVTALMEERRRFEQWIAALDARRDTTPAHVFARVHADYERRLAAVVEKLVSHGDALETRATELRVELDVVAQDEGRCRDERAELELRAHVGELAQKDFNRTVKGLDEALAKFAARRAELGEEMRGIEELLDAVRAEQAAHAAEPEPEAPAAQPAPARQSVPVAVHPEPETASESLGEPMTSEDEEPEPLASDDAFRAALATPGSPRPSRPIKAQVEPELFDASAAVEPPSTEVAPVIEEPGVDAHPVGETDDDRRSVTPSNTFDELAFLNSVVADAAGTEPGGDRPKESGPKARGSKEAVAVNITGDHPIVLKSAAEGNAQQKSLKCADCGTMNFPTDWYCERCGAELASL